MRGFAIFADGLHDIANLDDLKPEIERAAYRAINATADWTRTLSGELIRAQINFPASYLMPSAGRLAVTGRAGPGQLLASITARRRATSLARFVTGGTPDKKGVTIQMKKGRTQELPNAFLMRLRSGTSIDTSGNLGLAIRTRRGERPNNAYKPVRVSETLWLLYGASISQVFQSVREDVRPDAEEYLAAEFRRLLDANL